MNCRICCNLFQELLENSLCEELIMELREHMKTCEHCRTSLRTYSLTITLSQKAAPPCCVSDEKMDRLKKMLLERLHGKTGF
jgi:hypothetical protein